MPHAEDRTHGDKADPRRARAAHDRERDEQARRDRSPPNRRDGKPQALPPPIRRLMPPTVRGADADCLGRSCGRTLGFDQVRTERLRQSAPARHMRDRRHDCRRADLSLPRLATCLPARLGSTPGRNPLVRMTLRECSPEIVSDSDGARRRAELEDRLASLTHVV